MKIAVIIVRILLGLMFVVFGLNAFLHFIPMGEMPTGPAGDFMKALFTSHYFHVVALSQILGGLLLLIGFVPLGLVVLGPILINILSFHIFLQPKGIQMGIVASVLALFLLWAYRSAFAALVTTKITQPASPIVNP